MGRLESKFAVVSGAGSGIGKATSLIFAQEGAHVICADINLEAAEAVVKEIKENNGEATALYVDVANEKGVIEFAEQCQEKFGRVDVLFNNAGIDTAGGKLHEYKTELWDKIMAVDLRGTFLVSKYIIPLMLDNGGSIINCSSVSGIGADFNRSGYNAAKGGVHNLTKTMAIDYARDGIRVNQIAPGTIDTPLIEQILGEEGAKKFKKSYELVDPMGRLGRPEEVGKVVLFLASDDSSYVTGESILIDGGHMAYTWPGELLSDVKL